MTTTGATQPEEIITGPKPGEESLANDLDNRREVTGDMLLGGHPNQEFEENTPEGGPEVKPEEGEDTGEVKAKEGEEAPKKEELPAGPRFKSQEEAEKAHAEAERRMHEATTKEAEERKARETLQREVDELKAQQAKPPEEKKEEKPVVTAPTNEERMAKIVEATKTANAAAVPKLRALDPDDPDYEQKYADIQTEITSALAKALLEASISPASLSREEVEQIYQEKLDADREKGKVAEGARLEAKAKEMAIKSGLDLADPESVDSIIWDRMKGQIPDEVYAKGTLEAQVEWVTAEVRKRTGKAALSEAEKEEAARITQENNQPLGKGGLKPKPQPKQETEGSLASDFEDARRARII
jgi:hypothetical protein